MFSVHVLFEVHPCCVLVAFSTCCQVINLSLFLAFVACLWLHEVGTWLQKGVLRKREMGEGVLRAGTVTKAARTWTCRCCCCALSVWAIWKLQQGCKQPLRGWFSPHSPHPTIFSPSSSFLFSFCQRHCLAFDVLVCVCFAHVRIFYGSKKTTPKWQTRWCACGNVNWGVYKLLSALAQHFFGPSCSFCCCCSRVCPFRTPNRQSSIYLAHTCVTVAAFLLLAMNT